MNILLILNPRAGRMSGKRNIYSILNYYEKYDDVGVELFETSARGDAAAAVTEKAAGFDRIVCCGGDGTLNETVSGLMSIEKRPWLGYIPAGSTNDFASSLGIRGGFRKKVKRTVKGDPLPIDIGSFNQRYFTYTASFGAFTRISYSTPQKIKNILGHSAYLIEGLRDLGDLREYTVNVCADKYNLSGKYIFGAVCNSTSLGGVLRLKRDLVSFNDGYFEIVLIRRPKSPSQFGQLVSALAGRDFRNSECIVFAHAKHIKIVPDGEMPWSLDGEYDEGAGENIIENRNKAIEILV